MQQVQHVQVAPQPQPQPQQVFVPQPQTQYVQTGPLCVVGCRVCGAPVHYELTPTLSAVRCVQCQHLTQVGPPPPGESTLICKCNSLIYYPLDSEVVICTMYVVYDEPACQQRNVLVQNTIAIGNQVTRCPHCNSVGSYRMVATIAICDCGGRIIVSPYKKIMYSYISPLIALVIVLAVIGSSLAKHQGMQIYCWVILIGGCLSILWSALFTFRNRHAKPAIAI